MASIKVVIRTRVKSNGKTPVMYRVTLPPRKQYYYKTGVEIEPDRFDKENGLILSKYPGSNKRNTRFLEKIRSFELLAEENLSLTKEEVDLFFDTKPKSPFHVILLDELVQEKYAKATKKQREVSINHFKDFNAKITIDKITPAILYQFIDFLEKKGLQAGSVNNNLKYLKKILSKYYRLGHIPYDPGLGVRAVEKPRWDRIKYLEIDEVDAIYQLIHNRDLPKTHRRGALFFSIACETGQSFKDLKQTINEVLATKEIPNTLFKTRAKSGTINTIPLTSKAKELYCLLLDENDVFSDKMGSYDKYNKALKIVALLAGIDKNLTTHMARHTCACMLLENDISIELVSAFLGHTDIKTTQIYAKIKNKKLIQAIEDYDLRRG